MTARRRVPAVGREVGPESCSIEHRHEILHGLPFFAHLSSEALAEINQQFYATGYAAGETVYFSGDPAERLFVVAHGEVKLLRHSAGGQDVLLDMLGEGEMFGTLTVLGDRSYPDTAVAQTPCCVLGISAADFQTILARVPEVALAVLGLVAERLQNAHDTISQISATPVESRVAAALLKLAEKLGVQDERGVLINTRLSRQDLAAMTGTTTETASRIMSQFRRDGLIESGREWIIVTNAAQLEQIASEA